MNAPPSDADLAAWIRDYTPQLLSVARAFAADDVEAEDILQDVWITAARRAHLRAPGSPLSAWLHAVTINRGRSVRRTARRRELLRLRWLVDAGASTGRSSRVADHDTIDGALWRAIADLPRLQRDVVLLRLVDDLSTAETAARLGRAEGTVKASLHRAVRTLRARLGALLLALLAAVPGAGPRRGERGLPCGPRAGTIDRPGASAASRAGRHRCDRAASPVRQTPCIGRPCE